MYFFKLVSGSNLDVIFPYFYTNKTNCNENFGIEFQ